MPRIPLVQRVEYIKELCAGKSLLHLGCTDHPYTEQSIRNGMLLHSTLTEICSSVVGLDSDEAGIQTLRSAGFEDLHRADAEDLGSVPVNGKFDVVLAGEIIEHLNNPGLFLSGVKRFLRPDSRLVITTVNAYCGMRFGTYALRGRGGLNEPVHPDHVAYYSYSTLHVLMKRHGLEVEEFCFYDLGAEHRPFAGRFLKMMNGLSVLGANHLADGVIAVCKVHDELTNGAGHGRAS